jgi:hypothetical protein
VNARDEYESLPERERARVKARDRKIRGPKVVADNPGLKKLQLQLGLRRRAGLRKPAGR